MRAYLDHNATSPLLPEVLDAMLPYLRDGAANPSSTHRDGQRARLAIEEAREEVAALAGAASSEIVFTSGGTEACNAAVAGAAFAALEAGQVFWPSSASIVSTTLEHPAVHRALKALEARGLAVRRIGPRPDGTVDAGEVAAAIVRGTILVTVMHVNNEIGTVQPVGEIAAACAGAGVAFHTDAVQALGRIPLCGSAALVSLSAHKIGGPQGVGALVVRKGAKLAPLLHGGPQEMKRRAGTENTAGIVGFGAAAGLARARLEEYARRIGALRDRLEAGILAREPRMIVHGARAARVANTSCFALPGVDASSLQVALDLLGISVSTGTACSSGRTAPSYVLRALGLSEEVTRASIRVSLGWTTSVGEIDRLLAALEESRAFGNGWCGNATPAGVVGRGARADAERRGRSTPEPRSVVEKPSLDGDSVATALGLADESDSAQQGRALTDAPPNTRADGNGRP